MSYSDRLRHLVGIASVVALGLTAGVAVGATVDSGTPLTPEKAVAGCEQDECDSSWFGLVESCTTNFGQETACNTTSDGCVTEAC